MSREESPGRGTGTSGAGDGVDLVLVEGGGSTEIYATALPAANDNLEHLLLRLGQAVQPHRAEILEMRIFGPLEALSSCTDLLRNLYGRLEWPVTCLEGSSCGDAALAGVQLHGVAGARVRTLRRDGRVVGRVFEDAFARRCVLGNLRSPRPRDEPEHQAEDTIRQAMETLGSAGMDIHNLVRTWFFVADILDWYPAFNRVRSTIYSREGVFDRFVPASTGIGAFSESGAALVASAIALQPKTGIVQVRSVPSPLQCPALDYGSSFSRAAEVVTPSARSLFVSGTASIDLQGATVHPGDVRAQIEHTLEVVGAILGSKEMTFGDVTRGNAYFRVPGDAIHLEEPAKRHGLPLSRIVVSRNDVCREDLLFELEVDAATTGG